VIPQTSPIGESIRSPYLHCPVCILDSQHARLIQEASADGDWRKVFRILAGFSKFNTVQRVLLPLCTSGNQIAVSSGTHWMLAELCLEDKVVCIYDWLPGKFQSDYELIAGVPHRVLFCDLVSRNVSLTCALSQLPSCICSMSCKPDATESCRAKVPRASSLSKETFKKTVQTVVLGPCTHYTPGP